MSKFKMKLKLTGFELEIEGSREDVPLIAQNVGQQLSTLLQPAGAIIEGDGIVASAAPAPLLPGDEVQISSPARRRAKRPRVKSTGDESAEAVVVNWKHDPLKYGTPQQGWSTAIKAMWLLYVVLQETGDGELSAKTISETFNRHFKQAGKILPFNVSRDLGKLKVKSGGLAPVAEGTNKVPSTWYLTQEGIRLAQESIKQLLSKG
ncbi:hypothetical protein KZ686_13765 [Cupriavidus cauae]|uniref:hypothetical protein n=1 Tax=Cupriavidus cauae TaxID=2608999 RepID=UPI00224362AD|nr:hypothetical protein [Cupriavidus cauae]UZN48795.1 hypothetical protein KZ686_13765 [Cupriavidus cauae]